MNHQRRTALRSAVSMIDRVFEILSEAIDREQECLDCLPESLQSSRNGERMESALDRLQEAEAELEEVRRAILEAIA